MNRPLATSARHLLRATLVGAVLVGGGQLAAVPAAALTPQTLVIELPAGAALQRVPGGPTWSVVTTTDNTAVTTPVITVLPASAGICSASGLTLSFLTGGTCDVTVQAPEDGAHEPSEPVVVPGFTVTAPTTTMLAASTATPRAKDPTVLTATVTADAGTTAPTGAVEFWDLGPDLAAGGGDDVRLETVNLVPGSGLASTAETTVPIVNPTATARSYDARYRPAAPSAHGPDDSPPLTVTSQLRGLNVDVVVSSPDPATVGDTSTVTVSATDHHAGSPVQPASSSLTIGGVPVVLGPWSGGVASGDYTPLDGAADPAAVIALSFVPADADTYDVATVTPTTVRVIDRTTTTLAASVPAPWAKDDAELTAEVTRSGNLPLTGTLEIVDVTEPADVEVVDTEPVTAATTATISTTVTYDATATYRARYVNADADSATRTHADSESTPVVVAYRKRPVTLVVTTDHDPAVIGEPTIVTVTATDTTTATDPTPHVVSPTSDTITIGGRDLALTWTDGVGTATYTTPSSTDPLDAVGTKNISLTFDNDDAYTGPAGTLGTLRVIDATTTTLTPATASPRAQEATTLTATVANTTGTAVPTGDIEFLNQAGDVIRTVSLTADTATTAPDATATHSVTGLTIGPLTYRARYVPTGSDDGTDLHDASQSTTSTITSGPRPYDVNVTVTNPNPGVVGTSSTVTLTPTDPNAALVTGYTTGDGNKVTPDTGTTTVTIDGRNVPLTWDNGIATGAYTPTTVGTDHTDPVAVSFVPATANVYATTPTITAPDLRLLDNTTTTLTPATATPLMENAATLTATVANTTGLDRPAGAVQFYADADGDPATAADQTAAGSPVPVSDGSTATTVTATTTVTPLDGTTRAYVARFVPAGIGTGTHLHERSRSNAATVTGQLRQATVVVTAPTGDQPKDVAQTVIVTVTDPDKPLKTVHGSATVTIDNGTAVTVQLSAGVASFPYTPTTVGPKTIRTTVALLGENSLASYQNPTVPDETFTVKQHQTPIPTRTPTGTLYAGTDVTVGATGSHGALALTHAGTTTAADCTISGLVVTLIRASTCQLDVTAAGTGSEDDYYFPKTVRLDLPIARRVVDVDLTLVPATATYGDPIKVSATATDRLTGANVAGTGTISWTKDPVAGEAASTGQLSYTFGSGEVVLSRARLDSNGPDTMRAGDYDVTVTFQPTAAQTDLYAQSSSSTQRLKIKQAGQVITTDPVPVVLHNVGDDYISNAKGGTSGKPVTMSIEDSQVCRPKAGDPTAVDLIKVGTCTLYFDQLGTADYEAAPQVEVVIVVEPKVVRLTVVEPGGGLNYESTVTATLGARGQRDATIIVPGETSAVLERVPTSGPSELVEEGEVISTAPAGTATFTVPGQKLVAGDYKVTLTFRPTDSVNWSAQPATFTFTVTVAPQQVVLSSVRPQPASAEVTSTWQPSFESTASGLDVVVTPDTAASVPENLADYARLPVTDTRTVNGTTTTTTITRPTTTCRSLSGATNTVEFLAQGPCTIQAEVPASPGRYSAQAVTVVVPVRRIKNTVTFPPPAAAKVDDELSVRAYVRDSRSRVARGYGDFSISRITSAVGQPETLEELPETRNDDLTAEWFGGGRFASFVASKAGRYRVSASFDPINPVIFAPVHDTAGFEIGQAPQVITQAGRPTDVKVRQDWTTSPIGGRSPEPVLLVVDPASSLVCHVDGVVLRFDSAGNCRYSFTQEGDANYLPADRLGPFDITVTQTETELTLSVPGNAQVGVPTTVTATALAGQQPVPGTVGTITVTDAAGNSAVPTGETATWVNGVGTLRFVPTIAGTVAKPLKVVATFTPTDGPAFSTPTPAESSMLVATGVQQVVVPTDHGLTAFVDDEWTPGERAGGNPAGTVKTTVDGSDAGVCGRDLVTGRIRFAAPGTCRVRMTMASVDGATSESPQTWAAAPERSWDIVVSSHPLQLVLTDIPTERLRYATDIPVEVQVIGDRGRGSERVTGEVTFWVDGVALPGAVPVNLAGQATSTVRFTRAAGEDASDEHAIRVTFAPDNDPVPARWAAADRTWPLTVLRTTQRINIDPIPPATMRVGQVWTPTLGAEPSRHPVRVSAGPVEVCTSTDGKSVTAVGAGPDLADCQVSYSVPGDTVYAPVAVDGPVVGTQLRPATIAVDAAPAQIARPVALTATVAVPPYPDGGAPGSGLSTAPAEVPAGTVRFRLDDAAGTTIAEIAGVVLDGDVATASYTPLTADPLKVTAEFVPAHPQRHASGVTGQDALVVAPVPTRTTVGTVTGSTISATVTRDYEVRAPITGVVDFSWSPVGSPAEVHVLGSAPVVDGVTTPLGSMPPADRAVVIHMSYRDGPDHAPSTGSYDRLLPQIVATADRDLAGWSNQVVTVSFTCTATSAVVVGGCPAAQVFTRDGAGQHASATIVAADGGTATASLGGIRIDRTDPKVRVTGLKGTPYAGEGPVLGCETSDVLTTATCEITTKPASVPGDYDGTVSVTATATDGAGNRNRATARYKLVQQWVKGRAPGGRALVVKRGAAFTLFVRTAGPRPQLMLPEGKSYRPGPGFRPVSAKDGMVTWKLRYRVAKKLRSSTRGWFGYRLAGEPVRRTGRLPVRLARGSGRSRT